MLILWILLAALLLLFLILMLRIRVVLRYDEKIRLDLYILFFRIPLYPRRKKVSPSQYTYHRYQKRLRKEQKKRAGKKRKRRGDVLPASHKKTPSLRARIAYFIRLFDGIYHRFLRAFRIDVAYLRIDVATGDAAKTAVLTGIVSQSVAYLCAILDTHTNLRHASSASISVRPDYVGQQSRVQGKFMFSIRILSLVGIGLRLCYRYLQSRLYTNNPMTINGGQERVRKQAE